VLALTLLAGGLVAVVQAVFLEWAFHRYWLQRPWLPKSCFTSHTLVHHRLCKFEHTFLNVPLALADLCLGSLVTVMPSAAATPVAARKQARRHSEFGRRMQDSGR